MKNKTFKFSAILLLSLLSSCGQTSSSQVFLYVSDLYLNKNYEVRLYVNDELENNYLIDNQSYKDLITLKTYRKYTFIDGYQVYDESESFNDVNCLDVPSFYTSLIDPLLYNDVNFDIGSEYILKSQAYNKFNFFFADDELKSVSIKKEDNKLIINCNNDSDNYRLEYQKSVKKIDYFNSGYQFDGDFYNSRLIDDIEFYNSLKDSNEDFVIIFNDNNCYYCEKSERLYYDFSYEYNCLDKVYSMNIREFDESFKNEINLELKNVYLSQDEKFRLSSYEEYPFSFLTPSALRVVNGAIKYIKPGFDISEKEILYNLFFN